MNGVTADLLLIETVTRNDIHTVRQARTECSREDIAELEGLLKVTLARRIQARRILFVNYTEGVTH